MLSGAKQNRNISDFSGRLGFLASLGMRLGICEIFNAQSLNCSSRRISGCPYSFDRLRLKVPYEGNGKVQ